MSDYDSDGNPPFVIGNRMSPTTKSPLLDRTIKREPSGGTWYGVRYDKVESRRRSNGSEYVGKNYKLTAVTNRRLIIASIAILIGIIMGGVVHYFDIGSTMGSLTQDLSNITYFNETLLENRIREEMGKMEILFDRKLEEAIRNELSHLQMKDNELEMSNRHLSECVHLLREHEADLSSKLHILNVSTADRVLVLERIEKLEVTVRNLASSSSSNNSSSEVEREPFNFASIQYGAVPLSSLSSPTLHPRSTYRILDLVMTVETKNYPLMDRSSSPRLGDCWCFDGSVGTYTIRLAFPARIDEVVYSHSNWHSATIAPPSAPKEYQIWGCYENSSPQSEEVSEECIHLADCQYGLNGKQKERCKMERDSLISSPIIPIIQLRFSSNHGQKYTCLYSIQIHGTKGVGDDYSEDKEEKGEME